MAEIAKKIDNKICLSTSAMCEILGVTKMALSQWAEDGCPKMERGMWPLKDVLEWRGQVDAEKATLATKKLEAEVKYKEQKAEESELKNAIAKGEYIRKEEITAELQRFFVVLKRSMLGYSRVVATELSAYVDVITARKIEKMVSEVTMDALEQISINGVYEATKKKR